MSLEMMLILMLVAFIAGMMTGISLIPAGPMTARQMAQKATEAALPATLPGRILVTALLLGMAWERLFLGRAPGISLFLFLLLLLAALGWLAQSKGIRPRRRNLWLVLPLLGLALLVALRAESGLRLLNLLGVFSLLGLLAHFYTGGRIASLGLFDYGALLSQVGAHTLFQAAPLLPPVVDGGLRRGRRLRLAPLLRGILLALPLLAFFALLLFSADLVFAAYVDDFFSLDFFDLVFEGIWRTLLILAVAWLLAGGLAYALLRARPEGSFFTSRLEKNLSAHFSLGFGEIATILGLVNLLFLSFVGIQFAYLFGGRAHLVLEGYSYAEYARRGFFELVTVAVVVLALIRGLQWLGHTLSGWQRRLCNALSSLMIGLVLVMLVSAFQRLRLYEAAFGYTRLRLMVHLFIVWLGLLLGWQALTLWILGRSAGRRGPAFALATSVAALGFLFTLSGLNPDALIARQNLARYQETGKVDGYYLAGLSADAVPVLVPAVGKMEEAPREIVCRGLRWHELRLAEEEESWTAFNLGRRRARHALNQPEWQQLCPPLEVRP